MIPYTLRTRGPTLVRRPEEEEVEEGGGASSGDGVDLYSASSRPLVAPWQLDTAL